MASNTWVSSRRAVASLHLDSKNPRLGRETSARAPREMIQYLFEHDKALEVAQSIATRGYFPNEPLLAVKERDRLVVVEGNRRLAALKALKEPGLLEGHAQRQVERLSRQIEDINDISRVPVTLAPSRRATDRQVAGKHIGTPVLPWQAENRASFILDKLAEGYTNDQLRDQLGFSLADIQSARQTRAIADMARSLQLADEIKAKLESPRAKLFTTLERVINSTVGRNYLQVKPDPDHGLRGTTTKIEFLRGFRKLVTDIALGKQSSRTLNTSEDIDKYFKTWRPADLPMKKRGTFVPAEVIQGRSVASSVQPNVSEFAVRRPNPVSKTVLPRNFKVHFGNDKLRDIRAELVKLKRDDYPNCGAVLLRVFFELSVLDYLSRIGELPNIIENIERRNGRKLPYGTPSLKHLVPEITRIAKSKLPTVEALRVEKAIKYDSAAPFTISELHAFVHQADIPSARDILQFWKRTEPLFRLMLERDSGADAK